MVETILTMGETILTKWRKAFEFDLEIIFNKIKNFLCETPFDDGEIWREKLLEEIRQSFQILQSNKIAELLKEIFLIEKPIFSIG